MTEAGSEVSGKAHAIISITPSSQTVIDAEALSKWRGVLTSIGGSVQSTEGKQHTHRSPVRRREETPELKFLEWKIIRRRTLIACCSNAKTGRCSIAGVFIDTVMDGIERKIRDNKLIVGLLQWKRCHVSSVSSSCSIAYHRFTESSQTQTSS